MLCAGLATTVPASALLAQADAVTKANALYSGIPADRRTDTVLLPVLAKLDAPPASCANVFQARLLPADGRAFGPAAAWATGANQKAALDALTKVTAEGDFKKSFGFGQAYGTQGVSPDLVRAGMYSELGDPPTLSSARIGYVPAMDKLETLVNVEATRLASDGKVSEALDALINLAYLARQMCDRELFQEAQWGLACMTRTMERIRDVAYVDMKGDRKANWDRLRKQIDRLGDKDNMLDLERMKFPAANKLGVEQFVQRLYPTGQEVDQNSFPTSMARLGASARPLKLFSETAKWRSAAANQAKAFDVNERVISIFGDWQQRWTINPFDRIHGQPTQYSTTDKTRFAVILNAVPDMTPLIEQRRQATTEEVGTRASLAVLGQTYSTGTFPPQLSAARPRWIKGLEADPYNNEGVLERAAKPPMNFKVPMRDNPKNERGEGVPMEVSVVYQVPGQPNANFTVSLRNDTFLLYSRGTDLADNVAKRVQNTTELVQGADYLIWPPTLSLYRQHLKDRGDL